MYYILKNYLLQNGSEVDLLIKDKIIIEIRADIYKQNRQILNIQRIPICRGFVDCHMHIDKNFLSALSRTNDIGLNYAVGHGEVSKVGKSAFTISNKHLV